MEKITPEPPRGGADMEEAEQAVPKNLRFAPDLERAFREQYARRILPGLRGGLLLQLVIFLLQNVGLFDGRLTLSPPLAGMLLLAALLLGSPCTRASRRFGSRASSPKFRLLDLTLMHLTGVCTTRRTRMHALALGGGNYAKRPAAADGADPSGHRDSC